MDFAREPRVEARLRTTFKVLKGTQIEVVFSSVFSQKILTDPKTNFTNFKLSPTFISEI